MSDQETYNRNENTLSNHLDEILKESRLQMQERTQTILLDINSHASKAQKEVRHHLSQFAQVKPALSNSKPTIH